MSRLPLAITDLPPYPYDALDGALKTGVVQRDGGCRVYMHSKLEAVCSVPARVAYSTNKEKIDAMVDPAMHTLEQYIRAELTTAAIDMAINGEL